MTLSRSQARTVADTLALSLDAAAGQVPPEVAERLAGASAALARGTTEAADPHPAYRPAGSTVTEQREVVEGDTTAAMGHPDPAVAVLGSPRIALWFELAQGPGPPRPVECSARVGDRLVALGTHHRVLLERS